MNVVYEANLNGERKRACEIMQFDASGRQIRGEAFYGAPSEAGALTNRGPTSASKSASVPKILSRRLILLLELLCQLRR